MIYPKKKEVAEDSLTVPGQTTSRRVSDEEKQHQALFADSSENATTIYDAHVADTTMLSDMKNETEQEKREREEKQLRDERGYTNKINKLLAEIETGEDEDEYLKDADSSDGEVKTSDPNLDFKTSYS